MTINEKKAYRAGYLKAIKESRKRRFHEADEEDDDDLGYDEVSDDPIQDVYDTTINQTPWAHAEKAEYNYSDDEMEALGWTKESNGRWSKIGKSGKKIFKCKPFKHFPAEFANWNRDNYDTLNGDDGTFAGEDFLDWDDEKSEGKYIVDDAKSVAPQEYNQYGRRWLPWDGKTKNEVGNPIEKENPKITWDNPDWTYGNGSARISGVEAVEYVDYLPPDEQAAEDKKKQLAKDHQKVIDDIIDNYLIPNDDYDYMWTNKELFGIYKYTKNTAKKQKIDVDVKGGIRDVYDIAADYIIEHNIDFTKYGATNAKDLGEALVDGSTMIDDLHETRSEYLGESHLKEFEIFSKAELDDLAETVTDSIISKHYSPSRLANLSIKNIVKKQALADGFGKDFINTDQYLDVVAAVYANLVERAGIPA